MWRGIEVGKASHAGVVNMDQTIAWPGELTLSLKLGGKFVFFIHLSKSSAVYMVFCTRGLRVRWLPLHHNWTRARILVVAPQVLEWHAAFLLSRQRAAWPVTASSRPALQHTAPPHETSNLYGVAKRCQADVGAWALRGNEAETRGREERQGGEAGRRGREERQGREAGTRGRDERRRNTPDRKSMCGTGGKKSVCPCWAQLSMSHPERRGRGE